MPVTTLALWLALLPAPAGLAEPAPAAAVPAAVDLKPVDLPAPRTEGGKPLMQCLKDRHSERAFAPERLDPQVLSNLLWAAWGVNRADSGKRTAPSARNSQRTDLYVALPDGLFRYEPKDHRLMPVAAGDLRGATGTQPFVGEAAMNLVYVARVGADVSEGALMDAGAHTGFISQNVYLYCASEGLATVVRGSVDRAALGKTLKLEADQRIVLAQSVGYPKKPELAAGAATTKP